MIQRALTVSCIAVMAASCTQAAAPWVRGYVVAFYDPAFRYGGRADYSRGTEIEPGVDCPHGSTTHFAIPAQVAKTLSLVPWRTPQEVEALANPPADSLNRDRAGVYYVTWRAASAYRAYNRDIQTYINPFTAEDPGQPQVTSRIGEGFNLDGKIKPNDFVSPDGEKGIDNQLYRAWGCDSPWRGNNGNGTLVLRSNDKMLEGLYTVVIRISGNKDPMDDDDATLEIGYSPDQIMKDARGNVGVDYSYRILQSEQYTKLKARIKDGVAETEQADISHAAKSPGSTISNGMPFSARARYGWYPIPTARRQVWWAAIATGATCTPRTSSPNPAVCRVFASMKITSRCTTLFGATPTAYSMPRQAVTTASPAHTA